VELLKYNSLPSSAVFLVDLIPNNELMQTKENLVTETVAPHLYFFPARILHVCLYNIDFHLYTRRQFPADLQLDRATPHNKKEKRRESFVCASRVVQRTGGVHASPPTPEH